MSADTIHASAVQVGDTGILILGGSGSGKSALALDLIDQCAVRGVPAKLIGDDRIVLLLKDRQAYASPAPQLGGLIEVRGSGIHAIEHLAEAPLHLAVRLVHVSDAVRMPPEDPVEAAPGVFLPLLTLPQGQSAVRAILARLGVYGGVKRLIK
jgi:serine kinase of HPr protein (carbohydrate metabolism regulator)